MAARKKSTTTITATKKATPKKAAKKTPTTKASGQKSAAGKLGFPLVHGKTFVFAGTLQRSSRADAEKLVRAGDGKVSKSVTVNTDYLISGNGKQAQPSAAEKKAETLNLSGNAEIAILHEHAFHQLFVLDPEDAIALLKSGTSGVKRWNESSGQPWLQARTDLSKADFRKCDLRKAQLHSAKLDACDFRGARLESATLGKVKDAKFDEASFHVTSIELAQNCSFTKLKPRRTPRHSKP